MKPRILVGLLGLLSLTGCDILSSFSSTAEDAVAVIDQGIADIRDESADWRQVLQQVATDLPDQVGELIRNDAQNLASRSIAQTGVEFRCNTDFLAHRATLALQRLKARVLKQEPAPLPPAFCQVVPDAIDLKANPAVWSKIILSGYDLDHKDRQGHYFALEMVTQDGTTLPITDNRIGRTTHYQSTINMGDIARELHNKKISKLRVSWNGQHEGLPQVIVLPWETQRRVTKLRKSSSSWAPPKYGKGDGNFALGKKLINFKGQRTASIELRAETRISRNRRTIQRRTYMDAREDVKDHTRAKGWSAWQTAYNAPAGKLIAAATPLGRSIHTGKVSGKDKGNRATRKFSRQNGEVASQFEIWVDGKGDDVPGYTRVEVTWAPMEITLVDQTPDWIR